MTKEPQSATCAYFVARKKRLCKMHVSKGKKFCGQHLEKDELSNKGHKRVLCPLDSKHSCYEHKMERHLKYCNAREKMDAPYFSKRLNDGETCSTKSFVHLRDLTNSELIHIIKKIEEIHEGYVGHIEENYGHHPILNEAILRPDYGSSVIRHLKQNSSLLAFLEDKNFLSSSKEPKVFIEFGAGRGKLSGWLIEATKGNENVSFLLVDKSAQRNKVDAKLKYRENLKLKRIRIDIRDLNLSKVDILKEDSDIIACGKHLCGAATDYSLRCLLHRGKNKIKCILIALCCHHKCTWESYTGKDFFETIGFAHREFSILTSLSSWAVSSSKVPIENNHNDDTKSEVKLDTPAEEVNPEKVENRYSSMGLSLEFRESIGRKAKQILDMGRVLFVRTNLNLDARLIQYIDKGSTLENIAIVALEKPS